MVEVVKQRILNVDDTDAGRYAVSHILRQAGYEVMEAANGMDALSLVAQHPDLVLLDVNLPDIDGFEVCKRIKDNPATASIPVVHLSATYVHSKHQVQGMEGGADGYLTQPVEAPVLVATIRAYLRLSAAEKALRQSHAIILQQAMHDELTGLPNRRLFFDRLGVAMAEARRYKRKVAVVFVDLDHFKSINDNLGHAAGDTVLVAVAERIKGAVREIDTLARFGGDEFALVLPQLESKELSGHAARRILDAMRQEIPVDGAGVQVSVSIGIAIFPDDGMDTTTLLQRADWAMYRSKQAGRNTCHHWDANMQTDPDAPGTGTKEPPT